MTVKDNVLLFLENNKGEYISGNEIAKKLNVSRNSIWKSINSLKSEGYEIDSIKNKGYSLKEDSFILSKQSILKYLNNKDFDIEVLKTVDSTNDYLKIKAEESEKEGTIVISEEQTKGKGRLGKSFYSPSNSGIYMSILLKPKIHASKSLYITTAAAVAVSKSIDELTGERSKIKWVNDIFLNKRKVCGILTEGSLDLEGGGLNYAVLGIGLNLTNPEKEFPESISHTAGTIFENNPPIDYKNKIIGDIINNFFEYYSKLEEKEYLEEYKNRSMIIGENISIIHGNKLEDALALDIDDEFRLKVKKKNGSIEYLSSGDVSIRKK